MSVRDALDADEYNATLKAERGLCAFWLTVRRFLPVEVRTPVQARERHRGPRQFEARPETISGVHRGTAALCCVSIYRVGEDRVRSGGLLAFSAWRLWRLESLHYGLDWLGTLLVPVGLSSP